MKEIRTSGPLMFSDPNCPTRVGEIINTISEIYDIPNPSEGMQVYVRDEKKTYTITGLKEAVIGGERVPNAKVDTFEAVKSQVEEIDNNFAEMQEALIDGSFVVSIANLANAVKAGAVTFEMLDGKLQLSASVVDDLETANTLKPLSANQGKVLKDLIDIINGTGEGSTDKKITDAIAKLVDRAPENLDTLRELANWIEEHGTKFAAVVDDINNIKDDALLTSSVHVSQFAEKINIGGKSLDGANTMSVDIPAATPENAGVMSAEQVIALQAHGDNLAKLNTTILNYNRKIGNYAPVDKATVVSNLGTAVERGMVVTYYTTDGWKSIRYISSRATVEAFANVDNWVDVDDFSAEDTETVVENIEEALVTEALRKTPQVLSDDEKAQVRSNIGAISNKELSDQKELIFSSINELIGKESLRNGFYDKGLIYREAENFCCAKINVSYASSVRIKSYVYGNAAITLTDDNNLILHQIADNYSTEPFLINFHEYPTAKWLYLSNSTTYVPLNAITVEATELKEPIVASITNIKDNVESDKNDIATLSTSVQEAGAHINELDNDIKAITGGSKTIDANGLIYERQKYFDASGMEAAAASEAWYISDYFPTHDVNKVELYARANWGFSVYVLYDENYDIIGRGSGIGEVKLYEITDFQGASYIRFHSTESNSYAVFEFRSKINEKSLKNNHVLVIGDSISTGSSSEKRNASWLSYGGYDKWVDRLIATGFFNDEKTYNCSWHATGFVADQNGAYDSFVKRLKAIVEPSKYEYVIVFGGINDWIKSVPMEDFKTKVDEFFSYLINNFTTARIVVLTPLQCYNYEVASRYGENGAGLTQKDYADYIEEVCGEYALPVLDLRKHSGFCPINETFRNRWTLVTANPDGGYWPADGTHPIKEYEDTFIAPMIKSFIEKFI